MQRPKVTSQQGPGGVILAGKQERSPVGERPQELGEGMWSGLEGSARRSC